MKKQSKGMNKRQIKRKVERKLGLDTKQMENMIQDINQILDKDIFSSIKQGEELVTIDKRKLVNVLKGKMVELEKELMTLSKDSKTDVKNNFSVGSDLGKSKESKIKINIS